jgi:cytochrome c oxidase assembly factor CtaG
MSALDMFTLFSCGLPFALFATGSLRLWRRSRRKYASIIFRLAVGSAGFVALALTLTPPLHEWAEALFSVHMINHGVLMAAAAPLLILSRPGPLMLWALPGLLRRLLGSWTVQISASGPWRALSRPLAASFAHGAAIWVWHMPAFFVGALHSEGLHWLQHASFFCTALLFWWVIFGFRHLRSDAGASIACLFVTALHTGLLGALLTFSVRLWYPAAPGTAEWGLTAIEDQQLAGVIMWIPVGLIYALAALALAARWISTSPLPKELGNAAR